MIFFFFVVDLDIQWLCYVNKSTIEYSGKLSKPHFKYILLNKKENQIFMPPSQEY